MPARIGTADELIVGGSSHPEWESAGTTFGRQANQLLVRFDEALNVDEIVGNVDSLNWPSVAIYPIEEGGIGEPDEYHRWSIELAGDFSAAEMREIIDAVPSVQAQAVRPEYKPGDDTTLPAYPMFGSLIVGAYDYDLVRQQLSDLGFSEVATWRALFTRLFERFNENQHPLIRFMRDHDQYPYRYFRVPDTVALHPLPEDTFFEALNSIAASDDVHSMDFDWARTRPYNETRAVDRSSAQWNLGAIRAQDAWDLVGDDAQCAIAVLDSGFDLTHRDLAGAFLDRRYHFNAKEFLDGVAHPLLRVGSGGGAALYNAFHDGDYHGTAVAGIIGAIQRNALGVDGVAKNCKLMPVRLGAEPTAARFAAGLAWAAICGVRVANMSFQTVDTDIARRMVNAAAELGMVLVAASGNEGLPATAPANPPITFPASHDDVIAVGAVDEDLMRVVPGGVDVTWGSQYKGNLDVVAPGLKIISTDVSGAAGGFAGDYFDKGGGGTSAAAPHVAGLAGMILAVKPGLDSAVVRDVIRRSARLPNHYLADSAGDRHVEVGSGVIDCVEALGEALGEDETMTFGTPSTDIMSDMAGTPVDGIESVLNELVGETASGASGYKSITKDARGLRPLACITGTALVRRDGDAGESSAAAPTGSDSSGSGATPSGTSPAAPSESDGAGGDATSHEETTSTGIWYRLYLNNDLSEWVEFDHEALISVRRWGQDTSPLGRVSVWLDASTRLGHGVATSAGGFLAGQMLRASQSAQQQGSGQSLNPFNDQVLGTFTPDASFSSLARRC